MRLEYFQLLDRIVELDLANRTIRTEATVPDESTIFQGHFPGYPLMPGVLLCETMAQTSGWLIIGLTKFERMPFLAAFKEAKLRTFITPGTVLSASARLEHEGSGFAMAKAQIRVEGKVACDASITFRVVDFPAPDLRSYMQQEAGRLQFPLGAMADGRE
jgi:3-hydroxyacyl-[acyl-carrier-protein] dehydratase